MMQGQVVSSLTWKNVLGVILCLFLLLQQAEVRAATEELLIGIEPEHNIFDQVERYRELTDYLSGELGVTVRLTIMSRYGEVLQRFKALGLDGAFLNSFTATMAIKELGLEPVARPVNLDGSSSSQGYIFVRQDSGIKTVQDMRGKSFVFVDPATTEGYLYPISYLQSQGVKDMDGFFSRYYFTGSHASAISAVLDSRADIGAAKKTAYLKQIAGDLSIASELNVINMSPGLPETTLCIREDMPADLKRKLTTVLLEMNRNAAGREVLRRIGALFFSEAGKSDFDVISDMARSAGILVETK